MPVNVNSLMLRHKVILAFVSMVLLMVLGTGIMLYRLSETVSLGHEVIQVHQPAALSSLQIVQEVNLTSALLNNYLLTGDKQLKDEFFQHKNTILQIHSHFTAYNTEHDAEQAKLIASSNAMLTRFFEHADRLFYLREHDLENYPGLALASELTDPHTLAYLGQLNELINSELEGLTTSQREQAIKLLYELRYSWIQMNNAFRIFMTTRGDTDLENFYSYSEVNGEVHKRLRALNIELGFDALDQLEDFRRKRLANVPAVAKVFQDEAWRQDAYIMKMEVNPLLVSMNASLQDLANIQIQSSNADGQQLAGTLKKTSSLAAVMLSVAILVAVFIASLIFKSIQPITALTEVVRKSSLDTLTPIGNEFLTRSDEVGRLANAFNKMTNDLIHDIRERKIAEKKFETLLESSSDATVIVGSDGVVNLFNQEAEKLFGYTKDEVIGFPLDKLIPQRFREKHMNLHSEYIENPRHRPMGSDIELYALHKNGREIPIEIGLAPIETSEGLMVSASLRDISDRKEAERMLVYQASYDSLTGLPNRFLALDRLSHAISSARRKHYSIAMMFIDLDNFKQVNDSLGHTVGDKLLQEVGRRLSDCVRANDTVARLGGDEFLVVVPELAEAMAVEVVAQKIINTISQPYRIDERDLFIGASIGITVYPDDADDPEVLLRNADAAMYQSKQAGRNTYRFFTQEMNALLLQRLEIESQLRTALENGELYLYYQPLFELTEGKVTGAEALLRWDNPKLGMVTPDAFISIAEETGLINKIGEWVLHEACRTARIWQHRTGLPIRVSVNISATQFRGGDLVKLVSQALATSGLPADLLELEITERVLIDDNLNVGRILEDIKRLGVHLALDDFGTGYSSLGYLKRFHFDVLKIDRMFISDITTNPETDALCQAIVAMAESLKLNVVAEGVETEQQFRFLRALGVHLVQGFYLSHPLASEDLMQLLARRNTLLRPV